METVVESGAWKARVVVTPDGPRVSTPAEQFVRRIAEVSDPDGRLFLACRALRRDEDCIEANLIVAAANESLQARLCFLNIAVEEGERLWTPFILTCGDVDLWDVEAAHPWLHAIKALGDEFFEVGWYDDARSADERFRAMDPGDHLDFAANLNRIGPRLVPAA